MSIIKIKTGRPVTHPAALPSIASPADQLIAMPSLVGWWQASSPFVTMANATEIDAFLDRAGGDVVFNRYTTDRRADMVQNALGGQFTAAQFKGTTNNDGYADFYVANNAGAAPTPNSPFTYGLIFKPQDNADNDYIFGRFTDVNVRADISILDGGTTVRLRVDSPDLIEGPVKVGDWNVLICSSDGTNLRMIVNGQTIAPVAATGIQTGSSALILGAFSVAGTQAFDGWISDALAWNGDLIGTSDPGVDHFLQYAANAYGL